MCFGVAVGAWVVVREAPPAYIENWQTGEEGKRKTARVLDRLEASGWTVRHDIDNGHGTYDHVVIGPPGVFLLDSKNPIAEAEIKDGELWLRRRHDPTPGGPSAGPAKTPSRARHD